MPAEDLRSIAAALDALPEPQLGTGHPQLYGATLEWPGEYDDNDAFITAAWDPEGGAWVVFVETAAMQGFDDDPVV